MNNGSCIGNPTNGCYAGYVTTDQISGGGSFNVLDHFALTASNKGLIQGQSPAGNIGYVVGNQAQFFNLTVGKRAELKFANQGTNEGTYNTGSVGLVGNDQFQVFEAFTAGDFLKCSVSNLGVNEGPGSSNFIGYVANNQLEFDSTVTLGKNAEIRVENIGINNGDPNNHVGFVANDQIGVFGPFYSKKNLRMKAINLAENTGTFVGYVTNSQIEFGSSFTVGDGSIISAYNGPGATVMGSQISFDSGFTLDSRNVTLEAINRGTVAQSGIAVQGAGLGGDVNVVLEGSSLTIDVPSPYFQIGALNGDNTSTALSNTRLVIDTDKKVNASFAGDIISPSLVKSGKGTQKLSGTGTLTNGAAIQEGTLVLNGMIIGNVSVDRQGILKGTGNVQGDVLNKGTVAPGESIGTMFYNTFHNAGGDYAVEVNGAGYSSLLEIAGSATLKGGDVLVSSSGGFAFHQPYTILDASKVSGKFAGAIAPCLILPVLSYDKQHVYLTLNTNFKSAAKTCSQFGVANTLDNLVNSSSLLNTLVGQPLPEVRKSLDSLSGAQHANDFVLAELINRQFIRRLYDPLRGVNTTLCAQDFNVWMEGGGTFARLDRGFNSNGYEVTGGLQKSFDPGFTLGAAGSYEHDRLNYKRSGGKEWNNTWFIGLYGLYRPARFYGLADFAYGHTSATLHRPIDVVCDMAKSKPKNSQYTLYGEAGYDVTLCRLLLQPFAGIEAGWYRRNHVGESGGSGWVLSIRERNRTTATGRLGVHFTANALNTEISFDVAWDRQFCNRHVKLRGRFAEAGDPFGICGIALSSNSVDYTLALTSCFRDNWRLTLEGSGESWSNAHIYNLYARVEYAW